MWGKIKWKRASLRAKVDSISVRGKCAIGVMDLRTYCNKNVAMCWQGAQTAESRDATVNANANVREQFYDYFRDKVVSNASVYDL